jgi:hypothetical protein
MRVAQVEFLEDAASEDKRAAAAGGSSSRRREERGRRSTLSHNAITQMRQLAMDNRDYPSEPVALSHS